MATARKALMSAKQKTFIDGLVEEREMDAELLARLRVTVEGEVTMETASAIIKWLLAQPRKPDAQPKELLPDVPKGRYAVRIPFDGEPAFFKVDVPKKGRWDGWTFVRQLHNGEGAPLLKGAAKVKVLKLIAEDPLEAAALYGRLIGECGVCGKRLRDPASVERGIGPVCAKRYERR